MKLILISILLVCCITQAAISNPSSILALHTNQSGKLQKDKPALQRSNASRAIQSQQAERLQYRGFLVVINREANGTYELQISKMVRYGDKQINSIYASQYETSVEYQYKFDSASNSIRQDHYLFPANSLTGWANPGDFVTMREFAWKGNFPTKSCKVPMHTSEEFGREYLEGSCFPNRDAAIQFAKRFVNYVLGSRGL